MATRGRADRVLRRRSLTAIADVASELSHSLSQHLNRLAAAGLPRGGATDERCATGSAIRASRNSVTSSARGFGSGRKPSSPDVDDLTGQPGCKACIAACPNDAIFINPEDHSAEKRNFCAHRLDVGLEPACVVLCPTPGDPGRRPERPHIARGRGGGPRAGGGAPPGEGDPGRRCSIAARTRRRSSRCSARARRRPVHVERAGRPPGPGSLRFVECGPDGTFETAAVSEAVDVEPTPRLLAVTGASDVTGWVRPVRVRPAVGGLLAGGPGPAGCGTQDHRRVPARVTRLSWGPCS